MSRVYVYVVDRDFGFAPNPFHGCCTLATCKPDIRKGARVGDWVIGVGGSRLEATGRCIFAMRVTAKLSFNQYWESAEFLDKKPIRTGSRKMMVGDNIYHFDAARDQWWQADSHHSNADGSINPHNLATDTQADFVLVSRHFYYFGNCAPLFPEPLLSELGYKNGRRHRVFDSDACAGILAWLEKEYSDALNCVSADPFDFNQSEKRYSAGNNRIS
jgi:putative DNA base modification enzyme with NMAD domain